tara:strand:+ start:5709 stop:10724 length:5016 start_codon:yes stop_codon:yes gene_type:complete
MASPLDLVNKHLQGLSQPNPLYDNNSSITINTANSLYNKYNSNPEVEDEEKSVYSQSDLIKKLQQDNSLAFSPSVETDSAVRYTLDDLKNDEQFTTVAERFLRSINRDENIYEYLRDSNFSPTAAFKRASEAKEWSSQTVEDYNYLRTKFDNAKMGGARSVAGLIKDSFVDVLFDPINLLSLPLIIGTGGIGGIALGAAGRLSASTAVKNATAKFGQSNLMTGASIGLTEGALDGGLVGTANQLIDIETNLREGIDKSDIAKQALIGASIGSVFGLLGGGATNFLINKRLGKATDEFVLNERTTNDLKGQPVDDIVENTDEVGTKWATVVGSTVGKPTTPLKPLIEKSDTLKKFLELIRYDALRDIFDAKQLDKAVESWGLSSNRRGADYFTDFKLALQGLNRKGFFKLELDPTVRKQLRLLMNNPNLTKDLDDNLIPDNVKESAKKLREVFNRIRKDGANIEDLDGNLLDEVLFTKGQFVDNYFPRKWVWENVKGKQSILKQLIIKAGHADPLDDIKPVKGVTAQGKHIDVVLEEQLSVDQDVFDFILGKKYRSFLDLAKEKLGNSKSYTGTDGVKYTGDAAIKRKAQELKADILVENMIDRKITPYLVRDRRAGERMSASQHRPFGNISDEDLLKYGFIDDNVESILYQYAMSAGQNIERIRYFGKGVDDFNERFIEPIKKELLAEGISDNQISKILDQTLELYQRTTGLDVPTFNNQYMRNGADFLKLTQQLAHLPFATISSLTEPLIVLSRADLADTPAIVKSYTKAGSMQVKKGYKTFLDRMSVLRGKEIKGLRALDDEDFIEAYKASIALEQSAADRIQAMYGEAMGNDKMRSISNFFFNVNLLQPWTETVQLAAFNIGKERTVRITKELHTGKNMFGRKLSKNAITRRNEELAEIGVDRNNALQTYKNSLDDNGILNEEKWKGSKFYNQEIIPSANMFAREIILNPTVAEANKPLLFSTPSAQLLIQFAGYPTAFNNVVLKNMLRQMYRYPTVGGARVLGATTLMSGVAAITNALRSRGESLNQEYEGEIIVEAVRRWGGMGPVEYPYRFAQGMKYGGGQAGALLKAPTGPIVGDIVDAIAYRNTGTELVVQNLPGYSALPPDVRKQLRAWARGTTPKTKKTALPRTPRAKGGVVNNVMNVHPEPDEVKMRGVDATYNEVAGIVLQDEEDRKGFAEGNLVKVKTNKEVYKYLTKHQNVHELDDDTEISPYKKADVKDFKDKKVYYTSLKENTNIARLRAYRNTKDIGLKVSSEDTNFTKPVKLQGHIKIKNPLRLSVKDINVDTVLDNLDVVKNKSIIKDKNLIKELIKDLKFEISKRDYALKDDLDAGPDEIEIINRSKSFVMRDALLKLGFDSIEYAPEVNKKAFVLLKENQFYPTEISRQKVYAGGVLGRMQKRKGGIISKILEKGDTLFSIARDNNVTVKQLLRANPNIKDPNKIFAGDTLLIPTKQPKQKEQKGLFGALIKKSKEVAKKIQRKDIITPEKVGGPELKDRLLPINMRQLIYDVFGGDDDLTEKDLSPDEYAAAREVAINALKRQSKAIEYKDYQTSKGGYDDVGGSVKGSQGVIKKSFDDPRYALKTTIGQASITTNDLGETILEDRYNFNEKTWKDRSFSFEGLKTFVGDMKNAFMQPEYGIPRTIGSYLGSGPGEGSMVKINLGKLEY